MTVQSTKPVEFTKAFLYQLEGHLVGSKCFDDSLAFCQKFNVQIHVGYLEVEVSFPACDIYFHLQYASVFIRWLKIFFPSTNNSYTRFAY